MTSSSFEAARRRHAENYLKVLSEANDLCFLSGDKLAEGLAMFDRERANIEAGQKWAAEHALDNETAAELCIHYPTCGGSVLGKRLQPRQIILWREAMLAQARRLKRRDAESRALSGLGLEYRNLGEYRLAVGYYEQALTIAREIGNRREEMGCLGLLGIVHTNVGDYPRALEFFEQSFAIAGETGDYHSHWDLYGFMAKVFIDVGLPRQAIEICEQCLAFNRRTGDHQPEGVILNTLGWAYANLGEPKRAIEFYEQALIVLREIGSRSGEMLLNDLGLAYADLGEYQRAIDCYERCLAIAREIGDRGVETVELGNLGSAYRYLGENMRAMGFFEQSLAIAREIGDRRYEAKTLGNIGNAYLSLGKSKQAVEFYEQALVITRTVGDRGFESHTLCGLGMAYLLLDESWRAIEFFKRSLAIVVTVGDRRIESRALWGTAQALMKLGDLRGSIAAAEVALTIYERIDAPDTEKVRQCVVEWKASEKSHRISRHLALMPDILITELLPFVAPPAILPSGYANGTLEILPGLVTALAVYTNGQVEFPDYYALTQCFSPEYLWKVAVDHLRQMPLPQVHLVKPPEVCDDRDILILQSQDPFGASRISYLKDLVTWATGGDLARYGVLVAVPTQHLVMLHVLSGPGFLKALEFMAEVSSITIRNVPDQVKLSPDVYFVAPDSRSQNVTQHSSSEQLVIETRGLIAEFLYGPHGLLKDSTR